MNRDAFKILLQNDLIPQVYKLKSSYLSIDDTRSLSSVCKSVRFQIENSSLSKCQRYDDFEETKDFKISINIFFKISIQISINIFFKIY